MASVLKYTIIIINNSICEEQMRGKGNAVYNIISDEICF